MQETVVALSSRPPLVRNPLLLTLLAGTAGFAANGYGVPIFGGTALVFGSFFSLLTAFTLGPWWGSIAAVVAFSRTAFEWGHPVGLVCFALEAFTVGFLIRRFAFGPLSALAIYWLTLGVPLAATWIFHTSEIPFPSNWAITLKYPVNGLMMALAALPAQQFILHRWPTLRSEATRAESLRQMLFRRFGVTAALPILALSFVVGHGFDRSIRAEATAHLQDASTRIADIVARHLGDHRRAIETLALQVAQDGALAPGIVAHHLEAIRKNYPGFLTLLATDNRGSIVAVAMPQDSDLKLSADQSLDVSDRDYFRAAVATKSPFVSDVFQGRGLGRDLIVAVSAPVLDSSGHVIGVVEGSLNLASIAHAAEASGVVAGRDLVVSDRRNRVVVALGRHAGLNPLQVFTAPAPVSRPVASGLIAHFHDLPSPSGSPRRERFLAEQQVVPGLGWHVLLQEPIWREQRVIAIFYLTTLSAAALAIGLALLLARFTANGVTRPISKLVQAARALTEPTAPMVQPDLRGAPLELSQLSHDVHAAALTLRSTVKKLELSVEERELANAQMKELLRTLDAKVAERTVELQAARAVAETASVAKSEFLASMSHELRTPLNVILGMGELLIEQKLGALNDRQSECLQSMDESGRHLLALINDILDLSKIEAGKMQLDLQPLDIRELADTSLRMVRELARKKNIRLTTEYHQSASSITGDPRRLKQILVNLLSNAVKFTPDAGRVGLAITQEANPPRILLSVWDTGIGISKENLARLFQPFVQIDSALSRRYAGTGLGLALVKRMVQMHAGEIKVQSSPHMGSRFTVVIPISEAEAGATAAPPEPAESAIAAEPTHIPGSPLLLLAEDNPANVSLIQHFAQMRGCRLAVARNGVEAIALSLTVHPDLILMDVNMPEMDGHEATRTINTDPRTRTIPIICLTAGAMPEDRAKSMAAGASAYLSKPVNLQELAATIRRLLPASRSRQSFALKT